MKKAAPLIIAVSLAFACVEDQDHDDHNHETEVISTVELTFTPDAGGDPVVATFFDSDGDGGMSGTAEAINLVAGMTYTLELSFLNELESPAEDITEEIREEAEDHFVFIAGDGVEGPASSTASPFVTHAYADVESDYTENLVGDDLPVGLYNTITATGEGSSELRVMLRHLPELNGSPQKSADLPSLFAAGDALPGDVDVDVTFELNVVP
ncbi:hypothetical protein G6O69_13485 [Pseudenhygromyxa sp. WMMC2535]|uniref:hypothetical protein n=1 Tax=Pseudenhygromyxa sp. WMMC2535 TaxID=2712867 RepID=UPI001554FC38|nr:hypothetical protein [Pseudenhygromyxa sp. WMMC2535]NVB38848.1 hypothetical protein [Pseudenhygromyxa sp. WMMC2535]